MALTNDKASIINRPAIPIIVALSAPKKISTAPPIPPRIIVTDPIRPEAVPACDDTALSPPMVAFAIVSPFAKPNIIHGIARLSGCCHEIKFRASMSIMDRTDREQPTKMPVSRPFLIIYNLLTRFPVI